jgi:hypothetical protein
MIGDRRFCFKLVREQCRKEKQNSLTKTMVYTHNEKKKGKKTDERKKDNSIA